MLKNLLTTLLILLLFSSCSNTRDERIKISATTWIGYAPLFYAKEMGWLDKINVKIDRVVSLAENVYLYDANKVDAFAGTQYEYHFMNKKDNTLFPIMMFDRSNGGDVVLSNMTLEQLAATHDKIDVYLEIDSINSEILKDFIHRYSLDKKRFNRINKDQAKIAKFKVSKLTTPTIVVTYSPYDSQLKRQGFLELASTKTTLDIVVVDALFTKRAFYDQHDKQFKALKSYVDDAILVAQTHPKAFYEKVKPHLLNPSYEEFLESLHGIVWLNKKLPDAVLKRLKESDIPTRDLL